MIQSANLGEISAAAKPKARAVVADTTTETRPADSVDLHGPPAAKKSSSSSTSKRSSSKSSSGSKSSKSSKASKAKETAPASAFDKASQKFLNSVVALQGCSEGDQKFIEQAIVNTHQIAGLDDTQKQFVMAQGLGQYAIGELGKMAQHGAVDPGSAEGGDKRWNALGNVIKTANAMVKAYPTTNSAVPTEADFAAGAPGGSLLSNSNSAPPAGAPGNVPPGGAPPAGPAPMPAPPVDPNQAAMDDYHNAMKIYQDIVAARQKNLADLMKIQQDTQTAIMASISNIWAGWAKAFADGISAYNRYLGYGGDPRNW